MSSPKFDFSTFEYCEKANNDIYNYSNESNKNQAELLNEKLNYKKRKICSNNEKINETLLKTSVGLEELYKSIGCIEKNLRLLIIGHNPSEKSWIKGHYYSNPANRMWSLLRTSGIVPIEFTHNDDSRCPSELGVGFTDLMIGMPETQSCKLSDEDMRSCKPYFYNRIINHMRRVAKDCNVAVENCYPKVVAFSGVRQWQILFPINTEFERQIIDERNVSNGNNNSYVTIYQKEQKTAIKTKTTVRYGIQSQRPYDWPILLEKSIVFLLPSSSGAAALTNEVREGPYIELSRLLSLWPLECNE
jgi:TDG/mug DNA glycosylase family protein